MIFQMLGPRWSAIVLDTGFALFMFTVMWATFKMSYQRVVGKAVPRTWTTLALDIMCDIAFNLPGAIHRAERAQGGEGLFLKPEDNTLPTTRPPPPPPAVLGCFLALAVCAAVACSGARSRLVDAVPTAPPRQACTADATRCNGLVPELCIADESGSTVTRWWPMHPLDETGNAAPCALACAIQEGTASCVESHEEVPR